MSFKNTIILMTSNAVTELPHEFISKEGAIPNDFEPRKRDFLMQELTKWFRPEFLNRVDDIILYQPLSEIGIQAIAANELEKVGIRLQIQGVDVVFDPDVIEWIARIGYDATYGARPLKRAINREILDPIAGYMLEKIGNTPIKLNIQM